MSTVKDAIFWLAMFWTPGLVFVGYLLLSKRIETD
jgi:hypothetical protein